MKKLYIDVMLMGGVKYCCSLIYLYDPHSKINIADVERFVNEKRPTLKYQKDVVLILETKQTHGERR